MAFSKLRKLLGVIMLRRTKLERADDLGLPPRHVRVRQDRFSEEEREVYESLYRSTARRFNTYMAEGTVLNNYANIFELLMRMRQASNHPDLLRVGRVKQGMVCSICQDTPEDPISSGCKHIFCREDARQFLDANPEGTTPLCPACFRPLNLDLEQPTMVTPPPTGGGTGSRRSLVTQIDMSTWRSSTKIEALVEELSRLRRRDATIKSIVFSQFVNFLDLAQWRLTRAGFTCCRLDGRMSPSQRDAVIQSFMTNPRVTIFLISLKAGGIALNLTEASNVFICDPWWNPAVEDQAMDRIHRLGQHRPIQVHRLIVEDSIESRMLQLQEKKRALFAGTVGNDNDALTRLTEEDLEFLFVM